MTYDMIAHLARQAAFSRATFGPGPRTKGVCEHIGKELAEIQEIKPDGLHDQTPESKKVQYFHQEQALEWTDVVILGIDGQLRAIWSANPEWTSTQVAEEAVRLFAAKQGKNERRKWPDWRGASPDKAIEHVRGIED